MRTIAFLTAVIFLLMAGAVVYDQQAEPERIPERQNEPVATAYSGKLPPDVMFERLDGSHISLESLRGRIVLLNFWATWCAPCIKEFPAMLNLLRVMPGRVVLLAVSVDEHKENIAPFLRRFQKEYADVLDSEQVVIVWDKGKILSQETFHTLRYPETIIIDAEGIMRRKVVGDIEWDGAEMLGYLRRL